MMNVLLIVKLDPENVPNSIVLENKVEKYITGVLLQWKKEKQKEGREMGFSLYGPYHIGWLIAITVTVILVSIHFKNSDAKKQIIAQRAVAWFILLFEIYKNIYLIIRDEFSVSYLPFELCSFAIFAIFYHAYTNNDMIGEILITYFYQVRLQLCYFVIGRIARFMNL